MLEPNNVSPLLDGFTLGNPISEHHGVVCCPAIKENTNKKYIVKIISMPANQAQFEALLLAGAYKDPGDAMEYFREKGEDILQEAEVLKNLSKIEGFLPFDGWQMEPITRRRLGYEVYLVGSYKRSLEKYMRKNAFTHLEAVNLGLDLCSALSVCRQSGYLYSDLKPSNIYVSEKKEFRIGDLGFLSLDSLRYASLPERYFSPYTPPELMDPMVSMNLTVDTYAVGMILYQLYNDGQLPFTGLVPPEVMPTPCHADYEMAEIIMKAIHPDPAQRWSDPKDLGKAIASYMQRNSVNDIPITPFIPVDVNPDDIVPIPSKDSAEKQAEPAESAADDTDEENTITETAESEETESPVPDDSLQTEEIVLNTQEITDEQENDVTDISEVANVSDSTSAEPEDTVSTPEADQQETETDNSPDISEEVAKIISKADDIIAHEIPSDTVFPAEEAAPDPFAFAKEDSEEDLDDFPSEPLIEEEPANRKTEKKKKTKHFEDSTRKNKIKKFFFSLLKLIIFAGICVGAFWYYQNVYLQTIDNLSLSSTQDSITVLIDTKVDESTLTVQCVDENGKRRTESVQGGKATFTGLDASMEYTVQVSMSGFHKLTGTTTDVLSTDATTQILSFDSVAGSEDGSVLLTFTVDGGEPNFWNIRYTADGEDEKVESITTHSTTISGLTIGKVYTFTLDGGKNFDVGGKTSIQHLASKLILAENITVSSSNSSDLTLQWKTPGDVVVENWNVRIYDGYGFEEQTTVSENQVLFNGVNPDTSYTVEITAAGMTQPAKMQITSEPISISDFQFDESAHTKLKLDWEYTGDAPENGWVINYTVDGSGSQEITCDKLPAVISPLIPGANYEFVIQTSDGRTVFNNRTSYQANDAKDFSEFKYVLENLLINLLKTPEDADWHFESIREDDFTMTFHVGDSASMVLRSSTDLYLPSNKVTGLFVFRDSYGNVLPELVHETSYTWKNIWIDGDKKIGEIDIPIFPSAPGNYVIELYFNGCLAAQSGIIIAE